MSKNVSCIQPEKRVDVYCPDHPQKWIGCYESGSTGVYYCWCKRCKKEIKIVMTK